jgi:hypothetical protein
MHPYTIAKNTMRKGRRWLKHTEDEIGHISRLVTDPKLSRTYYPTIPRKSKLRILSDLLWWRWRHGETNAYYYVYGLDRRDAKINSYLPYPQFRSIRDGKNLMPGSKGYNYVCLLRDKFVFSQFVASLGFPTPKNLALCNANEVIWLTPRRTVPLATWFEDKTLQIDGFCKKFTGIMGQGAFPLSIHQGQVCSGEQVLTLAELQARFDGHYLLQERIEQHPTLSALHPASLNTVRLITYNERNRVTPFLAELRIGTHGNHVDNWAAGGVVVHIDLATGRLGEEGFFKPGYGGIVRHHPDTHIPFAGFEIPYFHEAVRLVVELHSYLYAVHSIGWDIGITPEGPTIIEGNDDWGKGGLESLAGGDFKQRLLAMYAASPTGKERGVGVPQRNGQPTGYELEWRS